MNLKSVTSASFFAPPIEGIPPIPIDPETGELIFPEIFNKAQRDKIIRCALRTFPALKQQTEKEEEVEKPTK